MIKLFFIVYYPRSGSTYLADTLTQHEALAVAPEANFLHRLFFYLDHGATSVDSTLQLQQVLNTLFQDPKFLTWDLSRRDLEQYLLGLMPLYFNDIIQNVITFFCEKKFGDRLLCGYKKDGWYAKNVLLLRSFFPDAKFIHVIRDGRAAYASGKKALHSIRGIPLSKSPHASAEEWRNIVRGFKGVLSQRYTLEIQYEALMIQPIAVIRQVLDFLEVRSDENIIHKMLQPHVSGYVVSQQAHLHKRVGTNPDRSRIAAWRDELSLEEIQIFENIAGRELYEKGYPLLTKTLK